APATWTNGSDLTGDGTADLIVKEYSGGAHCCARWRMISLASPPIVLTDIDNGGSVKFPFKDYDGDGAFEVERHDTTFNYWNASLAESPVITLVYRLANGQLTFAPDLMKKPPLTTDELHRRSSALDWESRKLEIDFNIPPHLWTQMLELIATGNHQQVEEFARLAWHPSAVVSRDSFLKAFYRRLHESPNTQEIKALLSETSYK
ncbi:MAG TPA: hypothetical protein VER03_09220, partial [Bryobacteraceae bacterium]|nr:hypothetical protein [Bryobacteraceae bacterium]